MAIRVVRLGSPRTDGEGVRFGTVRRPPRGVPREAFAARDFYDVWMPELAPSAGLLAFANAEPLAGRRWDTYVRRYRSEMRAPAARRLIEALAALSHTANFAVGCYCADESHCHRSLLRQLLLDSGAAIA